MSMGLVVRLCLSVYSSVYPPCLPALSVCPSVSRLSGCLSFTNPSDPAKDGGVNYRWAQVMTLNS